MSPLSRADLGVLFREAPTALLLADGRGRIRTANRRAAELLGHEPDDLAGRPVEDLLPSWPAEAIDRRPEAGERRFVPIPMWAGREMEPRRRDGSRLPVEVGLRPVSLEDGIRVIAALRNVSERREFRAWGTEELEAAEEERLRVAHELHDDLAQRLSALQIVAKLLEQAVVPGTEELVAKLRDEVQASTEAVGRVIRGLRPPALAELGLAPAIRQEARRQVGGAPVEADLEIPSPGDRPEEHKELALYRIAQEALHNAVEHGEPSRIAVRLERRDGHFALEVEDDGRGFDPERVAREKERYGLIGMRERAGAVGGRLELRTAPGEGTRLRVLVPDGARPGGRERRAGGAGRQPPRRRDRPGAGDRGEGERPGRGPDGKRPKGGRSRR